MKLRDRYRGALLGLAVGDALGTTLEFKRPGSFTAITDMVGGGPFNLKPGHWTDDTSMALCLAESLIECKGFDPVDQLTRYCRWWRSGHLSSTGKCFDIGTTTWEALADVLARGERQLVVLDDVLTATDTGRFARVMGVLEEAAQRLQVLILTCHPERYRGLAGANFVDLEAIVRGVG